MPDQEIRSVTKFCYFHETKPTHNKVARFLANLAKYVLRLFFSQIAFRYMFIPLPNPKRVIQRGRALPSLSHTCLFDAENVYNALPRFVVFLVLFLSNPFFLLGHCFTLFTTTRDLFQNPLPYLKMT